MKIVIIPQKTKECIVHDGKKYCESENMTAKDAGLFLVLVFLLFLWCWFCISIDEAFNYGIGTLLMFSPLLILGLYLCLA